MDTTYLLFGIFKISLIILTAYVSYYYYKYFTRENPLPGPFPLPFLGNTHFIFKTGTFDVTDVQAKYGDFCEFYVGAQRYILLGNNQIIQKVLKTTLNGPFHSRGNDDNEGLDEIGILNTGLFFNDDYNNWQYYRRFFTKVVMTASFVKQSVVVVQNNFKEMEKCWDKLGDDMEYEFNYWMKQYFFDTIYIVTTSKPAYALASYYNKVVTNEKLKSTVPERILKESDMFINSADVYVHSLNYFILVPRFIRHFPGIYKYTNQLKETIDYYRNNLYKVIRSRREEINKTPIDQKLEPDMLTMFLTVNTERDVTERIADDLHDKPMTDNEVVTTFMEVMSAGIDTSSNSMSFLVNYLERAPKTKQRMIEEIERVLGKDANVPFTMEQLSKLEYVEAVILESARLRGIIPTLFKKNSIPEEVGGYRWSKDTLFLINYDGVQTHESYWKDPHEFNPDRFIESPEDKSKVYMFGGGLRKCPGRNFAMMGLKATLSMLYRKYDIELLGPIKEHMGTPRTCTELKVKLRKKKNLQ